MPGNQKCKHSFSLLTRAPRRPFRSISRIPLKGTVLALIQLAFRTVSRSMSDFLMRHEVMNDVLMILMMWSMKMMIMMVVR